MCAYKNPLHKYKSREGTITSLIIAGTKAGMGPTEILQALPEIHRGKPLTRNTVDSIANQARAMGISLPKNGLAKRKKETIKKREKLAQIIITHTGTKKELAKRFGIQEKTLSAIITTLRKMGFDIPKENRRKKVQYTPEGLRWVEENWAEIEKVIISTFNKRKNGNRNQVGDFRGFVLEKLPAIIAKYDKTKGLTLLQYTKYLIAKYLYQDFMREQIAQALGGGIRKAKLTISALIKQDKGRPLTIKEKQLIREYRQMVAGENNHLREWHQKQE